MLATKMVQKVKREQKKLGTSYKYVQKINPKDNPYEFVCLI